MAEKLTDSFEWRAKGEKDSRWSVLRWLFLPGCGQLVADSRLLLPPS